MVPLRMPFPILCDWTKLFAKFFYNCSKSAAKLFILNKDFLFKKSQYKSIQHLGIPDPTIHTPLYLDVKDRHLFFHPPWGCTYYAYWDALRLIMDVKSGYFRYRSRHDDSNQSGYSHNKPGSKSLRSFSCAVCAVWLCSSHLIHSLCNHMNELVKKITVSGLYS